MISLTIIHPHNSFDQKNPDFSRKSGFFIPIQRWAIAYNPTSSRDSKSVSCWAIALLEEALRRSRQMNQSQVGAWLLNQFQQQES